MPHTDDGTPTSAADQTRLLRIYVNDHLAAATAGVALARRSQRSNQGTPLGDFLEELVAQISTDRGTLIRVIAALGLPVDRVKIAFGEIGEKVGRLKLNGSLLRYSALSRLLELEGLSAGVDMKQAMWRSLAETVGTDPRLAHIDFGTLISRAEKQRAALEEHRLAAARRAFPGGGGA